MSFNNYKKFENVGIRSSNDTLIVMDSSNNNISLHSSDGGDDNVDTLSIKNIINKTPNMDLNLSSLNGTTINPVITINNNNGDCRIMTNLNVNGNINLTNDGIIKTTGIGSFGSINCGVGTFTSLDASDGLIKTTGQGSFSSINCGVGSFSSITATGQGSFSSINCGVGTFTSARINGKVGIGTLNPQYSLDVGGDIQCIGNVNVNHLNANNTSTVITSVEKEKNTISSNFEKGWEITGNMQGRQIAITGTNANQYYPFIGSKRDGSNYLIHLFNIGNVYEITGTTTNNLKHTFVEGSVYAKTTLLSSDDRLKINEELIQNSTNTLLKLRPQVYDKKNSLSGSETKKEAGLIVQEIYYEAPELRYLIDIPKDSTLIDDNKYRNFDDIRNDPDYSNWGTSPAHLNYIGLIPYLIQGFKEQQTKIDTLETKNQQQQTKINELTSIIDKLKTANSFEEFKQTL
jgi:DUF2075 family protein